jgi:hypothetical protein
VSFEGISNPFGSALRVANFDDENHMIVRAAAGIFTPLLATL